MVQFPYPNREIMDVPCRPVNEQAEERLDLIIEQMKATEGVTEELKARNQLEWVGRMNNIRNRAEEIIKSELIYI